MKNGLTIPTYLSIPSLAGVLHSFHEHLPFNTHPSSGIASNSEYSQIHYRVQSLGWCEDSLKRQEKLDSGRVDQSINLHDSVVICVTVLLFCTRISIGIPARYLLWNPWSYIISTALTVLLLKPCTVAVIPAWFIASFPLASVVHEVCNGFRYDRHAQNIFLFA